MTAIFVSGFEYDTDEEAVKKHFSTAGAIKELYFQSKGSCVVTYEKEASAQKALETLHETTMKGQSRYVAIKLDGKRSEKGSSKGSGKGKGKDAGKDSGKTYRKRETNATGATIYISGFDFSTDESIVSDHFSTVGAISDLYFQSKGSCVITYEEAAAAQRAVAELHETTMKGQSRYVAVKLDEREPGKGSGKGSGKKGGSSGGTAIYVSGFDFRTTEDSTLRKHFAWVGAIKDIYFQSSGSAVITYADAAAAHRAVAELHETTMKGQSRYVAVKLDDADRAKGKGKGKGKR